jgi:hypothetical protein
LLTYLLTYGILLKLQDVKFHENLFSGSPVPYTQPEGQPATREYSKTDRSSEERAHTQTVCPTESCISCLIPAPDPGRPCAQSPNSCSLPSSILVTRLLKIPPQCYPRIYFSVFSVAVRNKCALFFSLIPPAGLRSDIRGLIHVIILTSVGGLEDRHSIPVKGRNLSLFCSVQTGSGGQTSRLFNGYLGLSSPGAKRPVRQTDHLLSCTAKLRIRGAIPRFPHTSRRGSY